MDAMETYENARDALRSYRDAEKTLTDMWNRGEEVSDKLSECSRLISGLEDEVSRILALMDSEEAESSHRAKVSEYAKKHRISEERAEKELKNNNR